MECVAVAIIAVCHLRLHALRTFLFSMAMRDLELFSSPYIFKNPLLISSNMYMYTHTICYISISSSDFSFFCSVKIQEIELVAFHFMSSKKTKNCPQILGCSSNRTSGSLACNEQFFFFFCQVLGYQLKISRKNHSALRSFGCDVPKLSFLCHYAVHVIHFSFILFHL